MKQNKYTTMEGNIIDTIIEWLLIGLVWALIIASFLEIYDLMRFF